MEHEDIKKLKERLITMKREREDYLKHTDRLREKIEVLKNTLMALVSGGSFKKYLKKLEDKGVRIKHDK